MLKFNVYRALAQLYLTKVDPTDGFHKAWAAVRDRAATYGFTQKDVREAQRLRQPWNA